MRKEVLTILNDILWFIKIVVIFYISANTRFELDIGFQIMYNDLKYEMLIYLILFNYISILNYYHLIPLKRLVI